MDIRCDICVSREMSNRTYKQQLPSALYLRVSHRVDLIFAEQPVTHLVLKELVHTAVLSDVSQQHLSSFNTNFIYIHT